MRVLLAVAAAAGIACSEPDGVSRSFIARTVDGISLPTDVGTIYVCSATLNLHRDGVAAFNFSRGPTASSCSGWGWLLNWSGTGERITLTGYAEGTETNGMLTLDETGGEKHRWVLERVR